MKTGPSVGSFRRPACAPLAVFYLWLTALPTTCSATTYFVDTNHPSARDSNPGTEALPFKTIGKATSLVNAGDTVFVKAGIYRETVILSRSGTSTTVTGRTGAVTTTLPITIAAYPGHEGKAIINAAEPVVNWRRCTSPQDCAGNPNWAHIYWTDVAALVQSHPDKSFAVRQVFQHGKLLPRSRYPDVGWSYPTSTADPMTAFADGALSKPGGYFNGAVCHLKTAVWQIDQIPIADFSRGTITLASSPRYAITTRFGYYITSIVGEINAEGEWAYDPAQRKFFLWPQRDAPEDVEFSYRLYCLRSYGGTSWNVVRGLTMRHAYWYGIFLYQSNDMILEDNTIEHAYGHGIYLYAGPGARGDNNQILRNQIRYCTQGGIYVDSVCSHANVEGNYIYATGVASFGGDLMNGRGEAIMIGGPSTRVYNNRIDCAGHTGIYVSRKGRSHDISYNYVTNIALALSDTGGLYTAGYSDGAEVDHIHHNIFVDIIGCRSMDRNYDNGSLPAISTHSGESPGIYVDEEGNNCLIENNTVINSHMAGIYFHWGPSNIVQNNTLYGNQNAQVRFEGKNEDRKRLIDDALVDNILFATAAQQYTLYVGMNYDGLRFGQSDRNYFYHPYNNRHIFLSRYFPDRGTVREEVTLAGWQALSGYDRQSRDFSYLERLDRFFLAYPRRSRIVYNATLDVATVDLEGQRYCDVQGNEISGNVVLQPFESRILIALDEPTPEPEEQTTDGSAFGNPF